MLLFSIFLTLLCDNVFCKPALILPLRFFSFQMSSLLPLIDRHGSKTSLGIYHYELSKYELNDRNFTLCNSWSMAIENRLLALVLTLLKTTGKKIPQLAWSVVSLLFLFYMIQMGGCYSRFWSSFAFGSGFGQCTCQHRPYLHHQIQQLP